ncbi:hypothetical protein K9M79_05250 [Candidatus Woesearchaeota archaeon]|nr:hypothetical protein [Candidatus Woesearchaeota archaeon]
MTRKAIISEESHHIFHYIKKITYPVFALFIVSYFLVFYSFGQTINGMVLLSILAVTVVLTSMAYRRGIPNWPHIIGLLGILTLFVACYLMEMLFAAFVLFIVFIISYQYYLRTKRREPLEFIIVTFVINSTFSCAIFLILLALCIFGTIPLIVHLIGPINYYHMIIMSLPILFIVLAQFQFMLAYLLGRTSEYDEKVPISRLIDRKRVIISSIIMSVIVLICASSIVGYFGIKTVDDTYDGVDNIKSEMDAQKIEMKNEKLCNLGTELAKTQIGTDYIDMCNSMIDDNMYIPRPKTWSNKLKQFLDGTYWDAFFTLLIDSIELSIKVSEERHTKAIMQEEFVWINQNMVDKKPFYDGTGIIQEHISKMENNVNLLRPEVTESAIEDISSYEDNGPLFDNMISRLLSYSFLIKKRDTYINSLEEMLVTEHINAINKEYLVSDTQDDLVSRALRLKIIETKIITNMVLECSTDKCRDEVLSLAGSAEDGSFHTECKEDYCIVNNLVFHDFFCEEYTNC